jgi:hypothetical protein
MKEEKKDYFPGNEPVSVDDLIFQIGEKELDLYRKRKAIDKLIKINEELKLKLLEYENNVLNS